MNSMRTDHSVGSLANPRIVVCGHGNWSGIQHRTRRPHEHRPRNPGYPDFQGVDAIPAKTLREIASECIKGHIDPAELQRMENIEAAERETLRGMIENMEGVA